MDNIIFTNFPDLTDIQKTQFSALSDLYEFWNAQINRRRAKNVTFTDKKKVKISMKRRFSGYFNEKTDVRRSLEVNLSTILGTKSSKKSIGIAACCQFRK